MDSAPPTPLLDLHSAVQVCLVNGPDNGRASFQRTTLKEEEFRWKELLANNHNYFTYWGDKSMGEPLERWDEAKLRETLGHILDSGDHPRAYSLEQISERFQLVAIIYLLQEAIFRISLRDEGWSQEVKECLRKARELLQYFMEEKALSLEYKPAVDYLIKWMTLHVRIVMMEELPAVMTGYQAEDDEFELLPDRSKGFIVALKAFYLSTARYYYPLEFSDKERLDCLREVSYMKILRQQIVPSLT
jgi:hypothetical protein